MLKSLPQMPARVFQHRLGDMAAELSLCQKQQTLEVQRSYHGVLILIAAAEGHTLLDEVACLLVLREPPER